MNGNIDPRVIKYLMRPERDRSDSPVDPSLVASMMDAASQFGMVDGRTADTSGVQKWAQGEQASQRDFQRRRDAREGKLMSYLMDAQRRKEQMAERERMKDRDFQDQMALASFKADLYRPQRQAQQDEKFNLWKRQQDYLAKIDPKKAKVDAAGKPLTDYQKKVAAMNPTDKANFEKAGMALQGVVDMEEALFGPSRSFTFSLIGDNPYTASRTRFQEALGRLQSGGAINKDEEARFLKMAPTVFDSEEMQRSKLKNLYVEFAERMKTKGINPEEALAARRETAKTYDVDMAQKQKGRQAREDGTAVAGEPEIREKNGDRYMKLPDGRWKALED